MSRAAWTRTTARLPAGLMKSVEGFARDGGAVVLDLSELEYVSSAGLRCFLLASRQAKTQHGRIFVAQMQPLVAEIFTHRPLQPALPDVPDDPRSACRRLPRGRRGLRRGLAACASDSGEPAARSRSRSPPPTSATSSRMALVQASGRTFASFEEAHAFATSELDFSLTHTFGGHTPCVEIEVPGEEYYVCDMGSGARPFGVHVFARQARRPGDGERLHVPRALGPHHGLSLLRPGLRARHEDPHPRLPLHARAGVPAAAVAAVLPGGVRPARRRHRIHHARARQALQGGRR